VAPLCKNKTFGYQFSLFFAKRKGSFIRLKRQRPASIWRFAGQPFTIKAQAIFSIAMKGLIAMSAPKKKPSALPRAKQKEEVNKKALIWIGAAFAAIVVVVGTLLILNV
jgi:hypothetical protein